MKIDGEMLGFNPSKRREKTPKKPTIQTSKKRGEEEAFKRPVAARARPRYLPARPRTGIGLTATFIFKRP